MNRYYKLKVGQIVKLWDGFIANDHWGTVIKAKKGTVTIRYFNGGTIKTYTPVLDANIWQDLKVVNSRK